MKELTIISGKGGTGKTSLVASFAALAEKKILCDADVDAADLHLIMDPEVKKQTDFRSGFTADIDVVYFRYPLRPHGTCPVGHSRRKFRKAGNTRSSGGQETGRGKGL